jgi:hypothetical protein
MRKAFKSQALWKSEYLGSDPELDTELFASQVGSGSESKPQRKMGSGSGFKKQKQFRIHNFFNIWTLSERSDMDCMEYILSCMTPFLTFFRTWPHPFCARLGGQEGDGGQVGEHDAAHVAGQRGEVSAGAGRGVVCHIGAHLCRYSHDGKNPGQKCSL